MSLQIDNDQNQMEVIQPNQEVDAVAGAIVLNGEPQPEVFKLDTDCWDEVFDFLSLEDVHSFGQTCKAFQRVTGQYFNWKYETVSAFHGRYEIWVNGKIVNGFSEFIQRINIATNMDDATIRYVDSNYKAAKQLTVHLADFNKFNLELFEIILRKIEVLGINNCRFDRHIFGALVESCENLKRFIFSSRDPITWPVCKHSTLQHLELKADTLTNYDELKAFLELSPNVRSIEMGSNALWKIRDANVELDDLAIRLNESDDDAVVVSLLNNLDQRGFYKKLHLKTTHHRLLDQLLSLPQLVTLYTPYLENVEFFVMANIKELGIYIDTAPINNMNIWASNFINIEHLFISGPNFNAIFSFICHSVKLKSIFICKFEGKTLDISVLNKERNRLPGARKVIIYVDEDIYLATKWTMAQTTFGLIELKRKDSHNNTRPHGFWEA